MAVAPGFSLREDFTEGLDDMLFQICEELQISPAKHDQAVSRYETLSEVLESDGSPFSSARPKIYPQGSMALGTTVRPVEGPYDLDFVCELSAVHSTIDPMRLIQTLYRFLKSHGIYGPMTTLKNRCVRVEYANDFYMDILPACRNGGAAGTWIKVPDCALQGWSDSDPRGYIDWFNQRSNVLFLGRMMDKAAPVPEQEPVARKKPLRLVVQLLKRWRDLYYSDIDLAPISIVLTTLAGHAYRGERSVCLALGGVLDGIVGLIDTAHRGDVRLRVWNPSNAVEDLSERWEESPLAYEAFHVGIRDLRDRWSRVIARGANVNTELKDLFGEEPLARVLRKRAQRVQDSRAAGKLGVTPAGIIVGASATVRPAPPNTFYGSE
jgi:hypothetical protein